MQNLQLDDVTARKVFPTAIPELKAILEKSFPTGFFSQKITDRIKTFEDACNVCGINCHDELERLSKCSSDEIAYAKIKIIVKALNEGWVPDWSNSSEYKYYPWFDLSSGSGLSYDYFDNRDSYSIVGSRLCFKSSELAIYAAKQFLNEYKQFFLI